VAIHGRLGWWGSKLGRIGEKKKRCGGGNVPRGKGGGGMPSALPTAQAMRCHGYWGRGRGLAWAPWHRHEPGHGGKARGKGTVGEGTRPSCWAAPAKWHIVPCSGSSAPLRAMQEPG